MKNVLEVFISGPPYFLYVTSPPASFSKPIMGRGGFSEYDYFSFNFLIGLPSESYT